jgi:CBF/Mak21 family
MLQLMGSRRAVSDRFYRCVRWLAVNGHDGPSQCAVGMQWRRVHPMHEAAGICQCRALYAVMLSPEVSRVNKAPMFVSLVFKARLTPYLLIWMVRCADRVLRRLPYRLLTQLVGAQAMKVDVSIKRVAAFAKRLLQVAVQSPAPFAAGILFLVSEVLKVCGWSP